MGFWQPVTNLRDYVSQNPPGTTFFLCLLTLAVSFICLSSYSYTHTLPNPDIAKDWNQLLSSLSRFHLCQKANMSTDELLSPVPAALMEEEMDTGSSLHSTKSLLLDSHLLLKVPLTVTTSSSRDSLKSFGLHTTLISSQLGLGGNDSVTMTLHFLTGNVTYTCLTISAPTHLLPQSIQPPECPASDENISPVHVEVSEQQSSGSHACYSLHAQHDPTLTVMLTQEEQYVAVRHLLEVSVCLLGVCLMLFVTISLTPSLMRRPHDEGLTLQSETEPLNDLNMFHPLHPEEISGW
ncbi:transmembrane protein 248 [Genypterus blacodes]|uniref:transmembrane protein 248 n=1 Tax=Genypterus blacodes TaxID=154954 RepID=UPI003F75E50C